jgi:dihydroceramidase
MSWGVKDTTSYFCEEPYAKTQYIAEYYNTMSAISYLIAGWYIYNVLKYYKIGISVICIGIGTMLLHGTQRYYGQWMDELSMLYFCFAVIQKLNRRINDYFLGIIYGIYFIFRDYWIIFILLFVGLVKYLFYLLKNRNKKYNKQSVYITKTIFTVSGILWLFDQLTCSITGNLYLHALWHVGTAIAILYGVIYL